MRMSQIASGKAIGNEKLIGKMSVEHLVVPESQEVLEKS
jgi:hypothetical protein